jgi:hypothetical protein
MEIDKLELTKRDKHRARYDIDSVLDGRLASDEDYLTIRIYSDGFKDFIVNIEGDEHFLNEKELLELKEQLK